MNASRTVLISALALSLAGCAARSAAPDNGANIERLTPEELTRMLPKQEPKLSLAELVRMSREGASAQAIIAKIKQTGARYPLSASQVIELHGQGVSAQVLDYIHSAREQELRDRMADEISQREQRHAEQLRREQQLWRDRYYYDPWWPAYPGYGPPLQSFGGFYWRR